jgi:cytochrome c oxidase cbb3-type subunit 3
MSTQPREHTDAKEMSARTDQELFKVIRDGGQSISKSVLMPPWSSVLTDEEINDMVNYMHELCKC